MITERPIEETRKLIAHIDRTFQHCGSVKNYIELVKEKHKLLELLNRMIHQQEIAFQKNQKLTKKEDLK